MSRLSIRRLLASALLAAMLMFVAACEVDDTADDAVAATDDTEEVDTQTDDSSDDAAEVDDSEVEPTEVPAEPESTEEPEPTEVPEPTATPEPESADEGTRENPIPFGQSAVMGDWEIRVLGATPDATQQVLDENMFNDPPGEGKQFYIARIEATYVGDDSSDFWLDITLKALDDGGVVYDGFDTYCGVIPDNIDDRGEAFPGATIEGNTCWEVNSATADSMILIVEPLFSFSRDRLFFALSE